MKTDGQTTSCPTYQLLFEFILRIKHQWAKLAERHNLTFMQLHTLGFLADSGPQPMSHLSTVLSCDASNVTGIVDRLTAQGFIERLDHPQDRRIKMVGLTAKGQQVRDGLMQEMLLDEQDQLKPLSAAEQEQLRQLLTKLQN